MNLAMDEIQYLLLFFKTLECNLNNSKWLRLIFNSFFLGKPFNKPCYCGHLNSNRFLPTLFIQKKFRTDTLIHSWRIGAEHNKPVQGCRWRRYWGDYC
ncbi:MAG: hypothetical protein RL553_1722 [Planctomycetota bacterium]